MSPASAQTVHDAEIECLALTIYFEARGEPDRGKIAVGYVVMNRVMDPSFPDTVCAVVEQGGESPRFHCQFSWWCDGRSDEPTDLISWQQSYWIGHLIYWDLLDDPTQQALWYHADYVHPPWKDTLAQGPTIGQHIFYNRVEDLVEASDRAGPLLASSAE
ncbi:cell wall hydrolase [Rhodospirillaceae bacterium SYSU D60014]|uniref:cell wall hydrolase n=1 Tax=Virgifigura deserti TaxID=2268457 RepID=UPI0013C4763C